MGTAPPSHQWRRSSFSSNGEACVDVSYDLGAVRDSKNPEGPTLSVHVRQLVSALQDGQVGY